MQLSEKKGQPFSDYGAKILSSLASSDALKIFRASEKGIDNPTKTINELELTQKRYYTWLRKLMDAGLIEKRGDLYKHTLLGKMVHESFFRLLEQSQSVGKGYEVLHKLQNLDLDSDAKKVIEDTFARAGVIGALSSMQTTDRFEQLVDEAIELVDKTEESIYLVSKYSDGRVAEAILRAMNRGVKANFITERKKLSDSLQMVRMALDPKMMRFLFKMVGSAKDFVRNADNVPFGFAVLDEKWVVIMLPSLLNDEFYAGLVLKDQFLAERLVNTFKDLWVKSKPLLEDDGT